MTAYFSPNMLTNETVMLTNTPVSEDYIPVDTTTLSSLGFKKAYLDGSPLPLSKPETINANWLYLQLYKNTKQNKWRSKIDTGKLLIPVLLTAGNPPKKIYRKKDDRLYTMAFLSKEDFESFDTEQKYQDYRLVQTDRNEHYIVNGIIINEYKL